MSFNRAAQRALRRSKASLDQIAMALMVGLVVLAFLLVVLGDHATVKVRDFSWQAHTVGADNIAFAITFTRPMDPETVEANLQIEPPLPGRVSWAGRRLAYTLDVPIPYGETYEVRLPEARDRFSIGQATATQFEPFTGSFQSRDRAIAFIGTQADEAGRLMLINFSQAGATTALTPPDLTVLNFEPYPLGDRLLFSAVPTAAAASGSATASLFTVATGLAPLAPEQSLTEAVTVSFAPDEAGTLTPILDGDEYQNLAFDLAPNGKKIVVQRVNPTSPSDFGPWVIPEGETPQRLDTEPGGEFLIGPDSQTLLLLQGQGTAIIPLDLQAEGAIAADPLDFLPEFGRVFDVTSDGSAAAMVDFNQNDPERRFTETLVFVTIDGEETPLLDTTGSILAAEFDPTNQILYVLASELLPGADYQEQPFLTAIALDESPLLVPLLTFPAQSRVSMNISPDGLAIALEVASPTPDGAAQNLLLPLFQTTEERLTGTPAQTEPQVLPFTGATPTWLP
ncbi:MAG: Ig-like domain-containing protein [Cyanobacteria bacterium J06626_4]